jgi:hypothetical protein
MPDTEGPTLLPHVYWLGGSACAGKTSVARLLTAEHGLALYSCDDRFEEHRRRVDPERHQRFRRVADLAPEELWREPPEIQAKELLGFYEEEWEMVLEDLAAFPGPVLAEGAGLLPERIADVLVAPHRAVWLIATTDFRRRAYPGRGSFVAEMLARYDDPERTFAAWMRRDSIVADALLEGARRIGGAVLHVDGSRTIEETAMTVAGLLQIL